MRLFVAIVAPKEVHSTIANAASLLDGCLGVKVLPQDNFHITLKFLGEVPDARVEEVERTLSAIEFAPFHLSLSGAGAYPNVNFPRAIWIGGKSPEAEALAAKVDAALLPLGFSADDKEFSVHLTVARAKTVGDIEEFVKRTGDVCAWEVKGFTLMKSALLPQGAAYEVLMEYKARG